MLNHFNNEQVNTNTNNRESETAEHSYLTKKYSLLETKHDPHFNAIFCTLKTSKSPTFSLEFLKNIRTLQDDIATYCHEFPKKKPMYLIWKADNPHIFSLGLDIKYLHELITKRKEEQLHRYLELCIDILFINIMKLDINPLISISLIRGKTFGGGFEAALTSDIVIAEANTYAGFPGINYNLLPSIGLLNLLVHRFPRNTLESLLLNNRKMNAQELLKHGFADSVIANGKGNEAVLTKINQLHDKHSIYSAIYKAEAKTALLNHKDLEDFKNAWAANALMLKPDKLHKLSRVADAQEVISKRIFHK